MSSRNNIKIHQGALVCVDCTLRGDITIGSGTIVHPNVSILAEAGPIIIGEDNLFEEQSKIVYRKKDDSGDSIPLRIGNNNVFEVATHVETFHNIGNNNVFECKSHIGSEVTVTNGCVITAACDVNRNVTLPENAVIYGKDCHIRIAAEKPPVQKLQLEALAKLLPNYHLLRKVTKKN